MGEVGGFNMFYFGLYFQSLLEVTDLSRGMCVCVCVCETSQQM